MIASLLLIATWACGALGFGLLAISQQQHWALLRRNRPDGPPSWLRPAGWALLGLAILPAIWRDGLAFGLLLWSGMLTISACAVVGVIARWASRS